MNWFERLTGFVEDDYASTQARLAMDGEDLVVASTGRRWHVGPFELPSLGDLRQRAQAANLGDAAVQWQPDVYGDVGQLHSQAENHGALFQVASQFNMLEMVSSYVTPGHGVTRYADDHTQGPACAMAGGAATLFRNYLVPVAASGQLGSPGDPCGQTATRQIDGLADLQRAMANLAGGSPTDLWTMRNGYAMFTLAQVARSAEILQACNDTQRDGLRQLLRVGWQADTAVTAPDAPQGQQVGQVFCAALPVAYCHSAADGPWQPLAQLVLEATYEATLLCAALRATERGPTPLYLTRVGGGAFGNNAAWIDAALAWARRAVPHGLVAVRHVRRG